MIKLEDFCNTVNGNCTIRVCDSKTMDIIYDSIPAYKLKTKLRSLFRQVGYEYVTNFDTFADDVDITIDIY